MLNEDTTQSFRDRPINIDEKGRRKWVYAKQPKGKWYRRRTIFAWSILLFLIIAPFLKIKGHPFMLLDIGGRQFFIFGRLVLTQDTYILAIIMTVTIVAIVLFTVAFGRLWCGWACPQTIFLEMVYRRIEYLFDGNYRTKRKALQPTRAFIIKTLKHITFFLTSVFFTNIFLMWFIGPDRVLNFATSPISENFKGFLIMIGISSFYYWIYAHFREQVCTMICPYGRMQGVLIDSNTISVVYDYKRGEPRGAKAEGDCIDCKQCISVCPTGMDIRNGTQLECINCTACIDECNIVMHKVNRPRNLIRYDSVRGVESGKRSLVNGRTIGYTVALVVLFTLLAATVATRSDIDSTVLRMPGTLYQEVAADTISNLFKVKIINKKSGDRNFNIRLIRPAGEVKTAGKKVSLEGNGTFEGVLIIKLNRGQLTGKSTDIELGFFEDNVLVDSKKLNFFGPSTD